MNFKKYSLSKKIIHFYSEKLELFKINKRIKSIKNSTAKIISLDEFNKATQ